MRFLTTKFGSYKIGKYEKATKKSVMDLLDIGNLEINKVAEIIKLGNTFPKGCDEEEEAYKKLDDYLAMSEDHSIISAFFDLIGELDQDLKIMKSCGLKVADIKAQFEEEVKNRVDAKNMAEKVENLEETLAE
jgi:hypothetical protein